MIYLYIDKNRIKLICLSQTLLGQYQVSYFQKKHENDLLEGGMVKNTDILASAIKEALTLATPKNIADSKVYLILPQETFVFRSYDVPKDISQTAILPFIKDKARAETEFNIDETLYDYLYLEQSQESRVLFFAITQNVFEKYKETIGILGLSIEGILPDTLSYFKLFEKTLKNDKKENILYTYYEKGTSFGYLYDSLGLIDPARMVFGDKLEEALKKKVVSLEKGSKKLNRIILSGYDSESVRQDFFTKDVGVWTNPLGKIIENFYREYLKLIVINDKSFSLLDYDVCIGAFIFHRENNYFSLIKKNRFLPTRRPLAANKSDLDQTPTLKKHVFLVFLIAAILSFSVIFLVRYLPGLLKSSTLTSIVVKPTPTPTKKPRPPVSPTPEFKKEDLKIKILNGSGTKGLANKAKDILKEAGFMELLTGNADSFDYEETEIQIKAANKKATSEIVTAMADFVTIKKANITTLEEDSPADLIIIIGKDFQTE